MAGPAGEPAVVRKPQPATRWRWPQFSQGAKDTVVVAAALVSGAFVVCGVVATVFYTTFGVTTEELGLQSRSGGASVVIAVAVLSSLFYLAIFSLYRKGISERLLVLRARLTALRGSTHGRGRVVAFFLFWAVLAASLVALVWALSQTRGDSAFELGPVHLSWTLLLLVGCVAGWRMMYLGYARWLRVDFDPGHSDTQTRQLSRRLTIGLLVAAVGFQFGVLLVSAVNDVARVKSGQPTRGWLYRAVPVTVIPLSDAAPGLDETVSHCLLYFGQADGVTVLYDRDVEATVRLPTSEILVLAPLGESARPASPCG